MQTRLASPFLRIQYLLEQEQGQDLLEYAFVVAIIALGAAAGMQSVAAGVNQTFTNVGSMISTYSQ